MTANHNVVSLEEHARARSRAGAGADDAGGAALDLVGKLFDRIGEDASIPAAVKTELARLRIPTLRAAQLERDFVANRSHPARHFLDAIAAAAVGLDDAATPDDPTVAAIARAVHDLLTDFDTELAPFDVMAGRLVAFVDERTRAEDQTARRLIQEIVARERADSSRRAAETEVGRRLRARLWVPPPVREILLGPWSRALGEAHRVDGEGSAAWQGLVNTMDDLLWSVEPKASPEGRKRLAASLPALVQALCEGLRRAGMPDDERDSFLSALVDCHAHAVKAGLRGLAAVPEAPSAEPADSAALLRTTFPVGDFRVEEIRLAGALEVVAQAALSSIASRLRLGAWIELERGARSPARKRIAWMSPATGACLLVGISPGSMAVSITPGALAEQVRRGAARVVDDAPLVERTLAAMLAALAPG